MSVLRRLSDRHQITIPPKLLRDAGLPEGGRYSIQAEPGRITLEPKEVSDRELEEKDWKVLETLLKKQARAKEFTEYPNPQAAKSHLRRLRK